jgi:hypothetical protein
MDGVQLWDACCSEMDDCMQTWLCTEYSCQAAHPVPAEAVAGADAIAYMVLACCLRALTHMLATGHSPVQVVRGGRCC